MIVTGTDALSRTVSQTHDEIEIVIVCDPPVKETREALEGYADDDRVRPIDNDERLGISGSRNRAIEHARVEYICILDDDDRWAPQKVEKQVNVMEAQPECGAVYTGGIVRKDEQAVGEYGPSICGDIYPEVLVDFDLKPYSSHILRAECFETVGGYDTDFHCGEDWEYTIRVTREYEYEYVDEPLVVRQFHDTNVSSEVAANRVEQLQLDPNEANDTAGQLWSKYREEIRRYPTLEHQFQYDRHISDGWTEIDRNNRRQALRYGWEPTKFGPTVTSLAICGFALLGPTTLDLVRTARDTVMNS